MLTARSVTVLPASKDEAQVELKEIMLDRSFGAAGDKVVIEELVCSFGAFEIRSRDADLQISVDRTRIILPEFQ